MLGTSLFIQEMKAFEDVLRNAKLCKVWLIKIHDLVLEIIFELHEIELAEVHLFDSRSAEAREV